MSHKDFRVVSSKGQGVSIWPTLAELTPSWTVQHRIRYLQGLYPQTLVSARYTGNPNPPILAQFYIKANSPKKMYIRTGHLFLFWGVPCGVDDMPDPA